MDKIKVALDNLRYDIDTYIDRLCTLDKYNWMVIDYFKGHQNTQSFARCSNFKIINEVIRNYNSRLIHNIINEQK